MKKHSISDEAVSRALGAYVPLAEGILAQPEEWLVPDQAAAASGVASRAVRIATRAAFGTVTPASQEWTELATTQRVDWWVSRIATVAGMAAATPRLAGPLAERTLAQPALGAASAGLAVCAVAREHGHRTPAEWVPLLATVLFRRTLTGTYVTAAQERRAVENALAQAIEVSPDGPSSNGARLSQAAARSARALWALAWTFRSIDDLLSARPRGSAAAGIFSRLPVVGLAGGFLDERGGIRSAAQQAQDLLQKGPLTGRL